MTATQTQLIKPIKYLLVSMYVAGIIGLNLPQTTELFKILTPFNLITSVALLLYFHTEWHKNTIIFVIIAFLTGFFIEVIGVNTGKIFGIYEYQTTLGFKIWGTPPLIGLNWLMLVYCMCCFVNTQQSIFVNASISAILLTFFDYIAEPVAIRLEMWHWFGKLPPLQNYIGWFIVSFILCLVFEVLKLKKTNSLANHLLLLQLLFFVFQRLGIILF